MDEELQKQMAAQFEALSRGIFTADKFSESIEEVTREMGTSKIGFSAYNKILKAQLQIEQTSLKLNQTIYKQSVRDLAIMQRMFGMRTQEQRQLREQMRDQQRLIAALKDQTGVIDKVTKAERNRLKEFAAGVKNVALGGVKYLIAALTGAFTEFEKNMVAVAKGTASTREQTKQLETTMIGLSNEMAVLGIRTNEIVAAVSGLNEEFRDISIGESSPLLQATTKLTELGLSTKEAADLVRTLNLNFGIGADQVERTLLNMRNQLAVGTNFRAVLQDMAGNATTIYLRMGRSAEEIAKMAERSNRMGSSLDEQTNMADRLVLNFEDTAQTLGRLSLLADESGRKEIEQFRLLSEQYAMGLASAEDMNNALMRIYGSIKMSTPETRNLFGKLFGLGPEQLDKQFKLWEKIQKDGVGGTVDEVNDLNALILAGQTTFEKVGNIISAVLTPTLNTFNSTLSTISTETLEDIQKKFKEATGDLGEMLPTADEILKTFDEAPNRVQGMIAAFKLVANSLRPVFEPVFDEIATFLTKKISAALYELTKDGPWWMPTLGSSVEQQEMLERHEEAIAAGQEYNPAMEAMSRAQNENKQRYGSMHGGGRRNQRRNPRFVGGASTIGGVENNAMGGYYNSPTLALIGEENRGEVVVPTERIRKGLPVNPQVANELASIGVPGFFAGASVGGYIGQSQRRREQQAYYMAGGDPASIRRREKDFIKLNDAYEERLNKQYREIYNEEKRLARYNRRTFTKFRTDMGVFQVAQRMMIQQIQNAFDPGTWQDAVAEGFAHYLQTGELGDSIRVGFQTALKDNGALYNRIQQSRFGTFGAEATQGAFNQYMRWESAGRPGGYSGLANQSAQGVLTQLATSKNKQGLTFSQAGGQRFGTYISDKFMQRSLKKGTFETDFGRNTMIGSVAGAVGEVGINAAMGSAMYGLQTGDWKGAAKQFIPQMEMGLTQKAIMTGNPYAIGAAVAYHGAKFLWNRNKRKKQKRREAEASRNAHNLAKNYADFMKKNGRLPYSNQSLYQSFHEMMSGAKTEKERRNIQSGFYSSIKTAIMLRFGKYISPDIAETLTNSYMSPMDNSDLVDDVMDYVIQKARAEGDNVVSTDKGLGVASAMGDVKPKPVDHSLKTEFGVGGQAGPMHVGGGIYQTRAVGSYQQGVGFVTDSMGQNAGTAEIINELRMLRQQYNQEIKMDGRVVGRVVTNNTNETAMGY